MSIACKIITTCIWIPLSETISNAHQSFAWTYSSVASCSFYSADFSSQGFAQDDICSIGRMPEW